MRSFENNIKKLLWSNTLMSTQMQAVVGTIFLLAKGFSLTQVMFFGSMYAIGALLSEIPTGAFSDRISRKQSLILSMLIEIPVTIIVILSSPYLIISLMFFIFGISASFRSGTDSAILYDTLRELDRESEFKKNQWKAEVVCGLGWSDWWNCRRLIGKIQPFFSLVGMGRSNDFSVTDIYIFS